MGWRDFFYFSKGERNALIILTGLILVASVALYISNPPQNITKESADSSTSKPVNEPLNPESQTHTTENTGGSEKSREKQSKPKETTGQRIERLTSQSSHSNYPKTEKLAAGAQIELNHADTTLLKKIPGIGSSFANRIIKYRNLLGGFYSVSQIGEVYGIDEEKYHELAPWFTVEPRLIEPIPVNSLSEELLRKHPYINYQQAKAISKLRKQKKQLAGWDNLALLDEFTEFDKARLLPYLSFE